MLASLTNRTFPEPPPPPPRRDDQEGRYSRRWNRGRNADGDTFDYGKGQRKRRWDVNNDDDDDDFSRRDWKRDIDHDRRGWNEEDEGKIKKKQVFDPVKAAEEMKAESEYVDHEYGKGVITVGFTEQRVLAYICEICHIQLNCRGNLEAHCDGIQHLKKKNLWEKRKRFNEKSELKRPLPRWVPVEKEESKSSSFPTNVADNMPPYSTVRNNANDGSYQQRDYSNSNASYGQDGYDYSRSGCTQSYGEEGYKSTGGYETAKSSDYWGQNQSDMNAASLTPNREVSKPAGKQGGATGTLIQRLDACAVKNEKDNELAFSVVSALLKSLKEFHHKLGDTKCIEVLTETDVMFRIMKPKTTDFKGIDKLPEGNENLASSAVNKYSSGVEAASFSTTVPLKYNASQRNTSTWYAQRKSEPQAGNQAMKSSSALEAVAANYSTKDVYGSAKNSVQSSSSHSTSGYTSQGAGSITSSVSSGYSAQVTGSNVVSHATTTTSYPTQAPLPGGYGGYILNNPSGYGSQGNYTSNYSAYTTSSSSDQSSTAENGTKDTGYHTLGATASMVTYPECVNQVENMLKVVRASNEPPPPGTETVPNYHAQPPPSIYKMTAPPPPYTQQK
ncbi:hypothetical protein SK128_022698 [Halocaridina rubra]|uniref:C2H2-type domain-containing protein n=1 Tax=Halocaridina rubra TaxID=373956 RepID=A0AAN8WH95_HALRR